MSRMLIAAWLLLGITAAQAQSGEDTPCRPDKIINASGLLIALNSGLDYQAYPGAEGTISGWLPLDKVTVCGIGGISVKITNSTEKNESVKAVRLFPGNSGGLL